MDKSKRIKFAKALKRKILAEISDEQVRLKKVIEEKLYNPLDEEYQQNVKDLAALYLLEQNTLDDRAFVRVSMYNRYELSDESLEIMLLSNFNVALHFICCVRRSFGGEIFNINANMDKYLENNLIDPLERIVFRRFI